MKKTVFTMLAIMMACISYAQSYSFPKNADGVVEVTETLTTSNDEQTNFSKVKNWINSQGFSQMNVIQEQTNSSLAYSVTKNTKSTYNPFAGQFIENLIFNFSVTVNGNDVTYTMNNMQIQETYAGFGMNNKISTVDDMIKKYEDAKKAIADAQAAGNKKLAKSLKKENKDILEDIPETLENASGEISKMCQNLKTTLGVK